MTPTPQRWRARLRHFAQWALTRDQRREFAALVAQRNAIAHEADLLRALLLRQGELLVSRANRSSERTHGAVAGWTSESDGALVSVVAQLAAAHADRLNRLITEAKSLDYELQRFSATFRFRSAHQLAEGLGLSFEPGASQSANDP